MGGEEKGLVGAVAEGVMITTPIGFTVGASKAFLAGHSAEARAAASALLRGTAVAASFTHPATVIAGYTGAFAAIGGIYAGSEEVLKSTRGKNDMWNQAIAACSAGSVVGVRTGSVAAAGGSCAAFAAMAVALELFETPGPMVNDVIIKRKKLYEPVDVEQ